MTLQITLITPHEVEFDYNGLPYTLDRNYLDVYDFTRLTGSSDPIYDREESCDFVELFQDEQADYVLRCQHLWEPVEEDQSPKREKLIDILRWALSPRMNWYELN